MYAVRPPPAPPSFDNNEVIDDNSHPLRLVNRTTLAPDGSQFSWACYQRKRPSTDFCDVDETAVIPIFKDGTGNYMTIGLTQWRIPLKKYMFGFPAIMTKSNATERETTDDAARRALAENCGITKDTEGVESINAITHSGLSFVHPGTEDTQRVTAVYEIVLKPGYLAATVAKAPSTTTERPLPIEHVLFPINDITKATEEHLVLGYGVDDNMSSFGLGFRLGKTFRSARHKENSQSESQKTEG